MALVPLIKLLRGVTNDRDHESEERNTGAGFARCYWSTTNSVFPSLLGMAIEIAEKFSVVILNSLSYSFLIRPGTRSHLA
jgi:hypothetical protein